MTDAEARQIISAALGLVKASGFTVIQSADGGPIRSDWMTIEKDARELLPDVARDRARILYGLVKKLR